MGSDQANAIKWAAPMSLSGWIVEKLHLSRPSGGKPHAGADHEVENLKGQIQETLDHQERIIEKIEDQKQNAVEVLQVIRGMLSRVDKDHKT